MVSQSYGSLQMFYFRFDPGSHGNRRDSHEIQYGSQRVKILQTGFIILFFLRMESDDTLYHLLINAGMSAIGFIVCLNIIPKFRDMFIRANLFGIDMSKKNKTKM